MIKVTGLATIDPIYGIDDSRISVPFEIELDFTPKEYDEMGQYQQHEWLHEKFEDEWGVPADSLDVQEIEECPAESVS